jgi:hypothetical protein
MMSAYRTGRAGKKWHRYRPKSRASTRDDIQYAEDSERMAHVICGMFCPSCGVSVGADDKHAPDCPDVPKERRRT